MAGDPRQQFPRDFMRVLITVPRLSNPGGVANYYKTLRPLLGPEKIYLEVGMRPAKRGVVAALSRLIADNWRFHRELGSHTFDAVHINPSLGWRSVIRDGILLLIAKAHRRPVLVFFRGWDSECEAAIRRRCAWLFRSVYGRADVIVVLAEAFRETLRELGVTAPILIETTVVGDALFDFQAGATPAVSDDSRLCEILYLSRLDRDKGLVEAIESVACLVARFPQVRLRIAGDGPERAAAEALVKKMDLGQVSFLGYLEGEAKVRELVRADIFLFPTAFGEGMPNAVLEAMASGLPVVTRSVGGLRDFFEDGRMGFITESRDPRVFAELLSSLIRDPALRQSMGQYNRDFARKRFAASEVAKRLLAIYAQMGEKTPS
jgi:glycosyltransferase involved in cell wall biosynthesis